MAYDDTPNTIGEDSIGLLAPEGDDKNIAVP
jgi:hypothetical protein